MRRVLAVALLAAVALAACSKDPGPPVASVDLTAYDNYFVPKTVTVRDGPVHFTVVNEGKVPHTFLIPSFGFKLKTFATGAEKTGVVELRPGRYLFYCDIVGHREKGMQGTLIVRKHQ